MFKENKSHNQLDIFAVSNSLNKKQTKLWDSSHEHKFYHEIFCKIDESRFRKLYSTKFSRPNVPINQLVGALILKHLKNWTYNELFQNLNFNLLTRHALGVNSLNADIFSEASIFNFQNRLIAHYKENNEDLLDAVFHELTKDQLKEFNVDSSIQRGDSFLVGSNIVNYGRLQLLIEVIRRLSRILSQKDKETLAPYHSKYLKKKSSNYVYHVAQISPEFLNLALVYEQTKKVIGDKYKGKVEYDNFLRSIENQFHTSEKNYVLKPKSELNSSMLMSPDDIDATYRDKRSQQSKGYVTHISETVNPKNSINLITDVVTKPNNVGDAEILEERLPKMMERTPELAEYFVDGQYGSPGVDKKSQGKVEIYQKTMRGRKDGLKLSIEQDAIGDYWVSCKGYQKIKSVKTRKQVDGTYNRKATFDKAKCLICPLKDQCKINRYKGKREHSSRTYYFTQSKILAHKRHQNFAKLEGAKRFSRANVEATVKEAKRGMKNGKVRTRGRIRITHHMIFTALAINFTRITKLLSDFYDKSIISILVTIIKPSVVKVRKIRNLHS